MDLPQSASFTKKIVRIIEKSKKLVLSNINHELIVVYWNIGKEIVDEEQLGKGRAGYGKKIIENLSKELTIKYGSGYSTSNLKRMRQFYTLFDKDTIGATLSH